MFQKTFKAGAIALAIGSGSLASAGIITADSSWSGQGSVTVGGVTIAACNTSGAGACGNAGVMGTKAIPGVGVGVGVQGNGNNELDWYSTQSGGNSEMLRFTFGTASIIDNLQLGLLFDGPEYQDYQEAAQFRVSFAGGLTQTYTLATLYSPAGGDSSWNGQGSWTGSGVHDGLAGLWSATNPFGSTGVLQIDFLAAPGSCGTARCTDQSDYLFRSISSTAVPEPGSMLLVGAGVMGLGLLGWKRRRGHAPAN
jgi:hypothetical protein